MKVSGEMLSPSLEKVSSMMTVGPLSGQTPIPAGPAPAHTPLARSAVRLAGVAAVLITVGLVALAVFGEGLGALLSVGVLGSLAAFAMGVVAILKHERWTLLVIPLSVFPVALAVLVLGELFWWE